MERQRTGDAPKPSHDWDGLTAAQRYDAEKAAEDKIDLRREERGFRGLSRKVTEE